MRQDRTEERTLRRRATALLFTGLLITAGSIAGGASIGCGGGGATDGSGVQINSTQLTDALLMDIGVDPRSWLRFDFTVPIDAASLQQHLLLQDSAGAGIPFIMKAADDGMSVLLKATVPYCEEVAITFQQGLAGVNGEVLQDDKGYTARTIRNPLDTDGDCRSDLLMTSPFVDNTAGNKLLGMVEPETLTWGVLHLLTDDDLLAELLEPIDVWEIGDAGINGAPSASFINDDSLRHNFTTLTLGTIVGDMEKDGRANVAVGRMPIAGGNGNPELLFWVDGDLEETAEINAQVPSILIPLGEATMEIPGIVFPLGDVDRDYRADVAVTGFNAEGEVIQLFLGRLDEPAGVLALPANTFGLAIRGIGDINADGYDDFGVSALEAMLVTTGAAPSFSVAGFKLLIFLGSSEPAELLAPDIVLHNPANSLDAFGLSFAGGGDVNGDGFEDLIVGAPQGLAAVALMAAPKIVTELLNNGMTNIMTMIQALMEQFMGGGVIGNVNASAPLTSVAPGSAGDIGVGKAYLFHGGAAFAPGATITASQANVVFTGDNDQEAEGIGYLLGDLLKTLDDLILEFIGPPSMGLPELQRVPDMFGTAVFIGEMTGDGLSDVIIGAPLAIQFKETNLVGQAVEALRTARSLPDLINIVNQMVQSIGRAYVFNGSGQLPAEVAFSAANGSIAGEDVYGFGAFIDLAGDTDNDGTDDFLLGGLELRAVVNQGVGDIAAPIQLNMAEPGLQTTLSLHTALFNGCQQKNADQNLCKMLHLKRGLGDADAQMTVDWTQLLEMFAFPVN